MSRERKEVFPDTYYVCYARNNRVPELEPIVRLADGGGGRFALICRQGYFFEETGRLAVIHFSRWDSRLFKDALDDLLAKGIRFEVVYANKKSPEVVKCLDYLRKNESPSVTQPFYELNAIIVRRFDQFTINNHNYTVDPVDPSADKPVPKSGLARFISMWCGCASVSVDTFVKAIEGYVDTLLKECRPRVPDSESDQSFGSDDEESQSSYSSSSRGS